VARAKVASDAKRAGRDSAAIARELNAWNAAHPAPRATLKDVADQIDYVRKVAGADHVGIGSDFDGVDDDLPVGLEDQSKYPMLFAELITRGWSDADLRKLAGENVLRALSTAEQVAKRLQKSRPPSTRTIQEMDGKPKM
jgi:membrane dipeptidase